MKRDVAQMDFPFNQVAGRPGDLSHNRLVFLQQGVEQTRLADVWLAQNDRLYAFFHDAAALGALQDFIHPD